MPTVSVVIVNWNGEPLLTDCLGALGRQTYGDFEVVLVDNGSHDGSIATARALMPGLRVVELGGNVGFARGNNIGIERSQGRYLVLLNNDTRAEPEFLAELVRAARPGRPIGMVAPKILNFYEPEIIDSVGGLVLTRDGIGQGRGRGEVDRGQYDTLDRVLCPSGCAALYTREMLQDVGPFAQEFFAYCEDSELGLRAAWAGWHAVSAPKAVVRHKYSASGGTRSAFKLRLVERNHYALALRTLPLRCLPVLPLVTLARCLVMGEAVLRNEGKGDGAAAQGLSLLGAFVKGHAEAFARAPSQIAARSRLTRRIPTRAFLDLLEAHRVSLRRAFLVP